MPQAIGVKSQSEQQGLPHLRGQAAAWCFARKLAFDHREDGLYFGARTIPAREASPDRGGLGSWPAGRGRAERAGG
jgi:hypothetical protein